jgi:hypothetical protein
VLSAFSALIIRAAKVNAENTQRRRDHSKEVTNYEQPKFFVVSSKKLTVVSLIVAAVGVVIEMVPDMTIPRFRSPKISHRFDFIKEMYG